MTGQRLAYVAAPPGQLYWRHEVCPHQGAKVLLLTTGNVCIVGMWRGDVGDFFRAWCPLPKDGAPPPSIEGASLLERLRFAARLIFRPKRSALAGRDDTFTV